MRRYALVGQLIAVGRATLGNARLAWHIMHSINRKAALNLLQLPLVVGALVFLPAGTLHYWQAWLFLAVFLSVRSRSPFTLPRRTPSFSHVACGLGRGPSKTGHKSSS